MKDSHYPHKHYFEPVALIDQTIVLVEPERKRAFKVLFLEPLQPKVVDFGPIDAARTAPAVAPGVLTDKEVEVFKFAKNELGQIRHAPIDPIYYEVAMPKGVSRFVTKGEVTRIGPEVWKIDPTLKITEIFRFEDTSLMLTIYNIKQYPLPKTRILFFGYRFILEPLPEVKPPYTAVPIKGWVSA